MSDSTIILDAAIHEVDPGGPASLCVIVATWGLGPEVHGALICVNEAGGRAPAGRQTVAQGASPGSLVRPSFPSPGGAAERMVFRPSAALCAKSCRFPRADALGYFLSSFQDENRRALRTPVDRQAEWTTATFPQDRMPTLPSAGTYLVYASPTRRLSRGAST